MEGNGVTKTIMVATGLSSVVILGLVSSWGTAFASRLTSLEQGQEQQGEKNELRAYDRGKSDQTLIQLEDQAERNRERILELTRDTTTKVSDVDTRQGQALTSVVSEMHRLFSAMDESLQREMRLLDDAMRSAIQGADQRLQDEIGAHVNALTLQINQVREAQGKLGDLAVELARIQERDVP